MTSQPNVPPADEDPFDHPAHHTGLGPTQLLAWGLVAFSLLMVVLAIVINLILGTPGG